MIKCLIGSVCLSVCLFTMKWLEMGRQTFSYSFFPFLKAKLLPEATTTAFDVEERNRKRRRGEKPLPPKTSANRKKAAGKTNKDRQERRFFHFFPLFLSSLLPVQCLSNVGRTNEPPTKKSAAIKLDCCTTQHKKQTNTHTQHKQTTHKVLEQFNLLPPPNAAKAIENRHRRSLLKASNRQHS